MSVSFRLLKKLNYFSLDVDFAMGNELLVIEGVSGAGKTTILNCLAGIAVPDEGEIIVDERLIFSHTDKVNVPAEKRNIGYLFQNYALFPHMTVLENLEMGAYICKKFSRADLEDAFNRFPRLRERRNQIAGTLSGGEQQMLAMGRALMSKPKLLMLDEPSMGLAPILVQQIFDIITELHKAGTTILLVEQNAEMALQIADRAYVLESGRITLSGTGEELMQSDSIKKAYLGG